MESWKRVCASREIVSPSLSYLPESCQILELWSGKPGIGVSICVSRGLGCTAILWNTTMSSSCVFQRQMDRISNMLTLISTAVLNPQKKYSLEYYMDLIGKIVKIGTHIIGIKDMAGVLKPRAATLLIGSIRKKYPDIPIHVHTHDSAGTGVATYVACAEGQ